MYAARRCGASLSRRRRELSGTSRRVAFGAPPVAGRGLRDPRSECVTHELKTDPWLDPVRKVSRFRAIERALKCPHRMAARFRLHSSVLREIVPVSAKWKSKRVEVSDRSWPIGDGQPVLEFSWLHGRAASVDTHGSHCFSRMPPYFRLPTV